MVKAHTQECAYLTSVTQRALHVSQVGIYEKMFLHALLAAAAYIADIILTEEPSQIGPKHTSFRIGI